MRLRPRTLTFHTWTRAIALAIPVHADQVIYTLRRTILALRRVFRQFRLPLNFSAGKTEALVDAFGPGARALRMALCSTHACSVENALMSMALRPFVFAAPASIWVALSLCRSTCHQKYWLVLPLPVVL